MNRFVVESETYISSGLECLPDQEDFDCCHCGFKWRQVYIEGMTDI